jgi:hypothetical protein
MGLLMRMKLPETLATRLEARSGLRALEVEILQEKAAALGRLGRALEDALEELRLADRDAPSRPALVDEAARVLWEFVVHREACRMSTDDALEVYKVPGEVRARMGAVTRSRTADTKTRA